MFNWYVKEITWLNGVNHGWGNGYIRIPASHWLFGKDYDIITELIDCDVHGGFTYSEEQKGEWIVGFDTAHSGDSLRRWPKEVVEKETARLAELLYNLTPPDTNDNELNSQEHCEVCSLTQGQCTC